MNLKSEHVQMVMVAIERHDQRGATVKQLVGGSCTCLSVSEVRRVIGWLYGVGMVRVVELRHGEPAWTSTTTEERWSL